MSLKKIRHTTLNSERNENTQSLKKFGRNLSRSHLKTSIVELNPESTNNKFEQELAEYGMTSPFMRGLFEKRCEENQIRPEEDKYRVFIRHFLTKLHRTFEVSQLRLKEESMIYFLKGVMKNEEIVGLDLSNTKLSTFSPLIQLVTHSQSICKLHLCNISLQPKDFAVVIEKINEMERVIHLDLSNRTFEGANKIGEAYHSLSKLVKDNRTLQVLELEGLSIRDKGLESLIEGFKGKLSNIVSLNLRNNGFSRNGYSYIKQIILNSHLLELDLSENRLGNYGISDLDVLKSSNITKLNLSNTDMESEGLCNLFHIIKDDKSLTHLILDKNNFQHNWFKRIEDSLTSNRSLRVLSMNSCHIKYSDCLFRALCENHILVKLELAHNRITDELEYLVELIKRNNSLKELKLRQCGVEGDKVIQLFNALTRNLALMTLDISDNNIGVEAGKQLLKSVLINHNLTSMNLQKTQIELTVKLLVENKLSKNKIDYQRQLRNDLKKESTILKNKEQARNISLPVLQENVHRNSDAIANIKREIADLSTVLTKKSEEDKALTTAHDIEMASLNKRLVQVQTQARPGLKELESKKHGLDQMIKELELVREQELQIVKKLERQLESERNSIKTLENKLEKKLDNEKYLNKKNNTSSTKLPIIITKPQTPAKPPIAPKVNYRQIKTISKIEVVRPH